MAAEPQSAAGRAAEGALPFFVSVIVPAYNAERTLGDCLNALLSQTVPREAYEVLVVDDGSTDRTAALAAERGVTVISQPNRGPAVARNRGVEASRGEVILFTDADCLPNRDWIEEMVRPFAADPEVVAVKGVYRTEQRSLTARFAQLEFEDRYRRMTGAESIDFVDSYSAGFRRAAFQAIGGFDPNFPVADNEDVDLSYKLAARGHRMVFAPRAVVCHRNHPASLRRYLKLKLNRAYWRVLVYKRYPEKIISDSYTPQVLKGQIFLTYGGLLLLALLALFALLLSPGLLAALVERWGETPLLKVLLWLSRFRGEIGGLCLLGVLGAALAFLISTIPTVLRGLRQDPLAALASPFYLFARSLVFGAGVLGGILSHKRRDMLFPTLLWAGDLAMLALAYFLTFWERAILLGGVLRVFQHTLFMYLVLFPFVYLGYLLTFLFMGLYRRRRTIARLDEFTTVLKATLLGALCAVTFFFFLKIEFSRAFVVLFWINAAVLLNLCRYVIRGVQWRMMTRGYNTIRVVVAGYNETGRQVLAQMRNSPGLGYRVLGFVDDRQPLGETPEGAPVLGRLGELVSVIQEQRVDEVFMAMPELPHHEILNLVVDCERTGVTFRLVSDLFAVLTGQVELNDVADIPIVDLGARSFSGASAAIKRLIDFWGALVLLLATLPAWIAIVIAIRLNSRGPAIFGQTRIGKDGVPFKLYRFRCLYEGTPDEVITPVGIFLRRTHLDELPQLLNVLKGEMSLVGPRPELPYVVKAYQKWQRKRLDVQPGITGLWQIAGRKELPLHENLEYDFYYIKNRSLLLDLVILLKTIPQVLLGKGRY